MDALLLIKESLMAMSISATRDSRSSASYYKFSDKPVGYTREVRSGVLADFDASGVLRGIEVTDPSVLTKTPLEKLVHEADRLTLGAKSPDPIKIPEL
jgi:hypothetical protein